MDQGVSRRQFARAVGATAGTATAQTERPDFGGYIDGAQGGSVGDLRGESAVTVEVGAGSGGLASAPTGVYVDPWTTITFEWVGPGHNVLIESAPPTSPPERATRASRARASPTSRVVVTRQGESARTHGSKPLCRGRSRPGRCTST